MTFELGLEWRQGASFANKRIEEGERINRRANAKDLGPDPTDKKVCEAGVGLV